MQRSSYHRMLSLALGCSAMIAIACSDESGSVSPIGQTSKQTGTGGTGSDTSHPPTPPTSTGPVASVHIVPAQAMIPMGYYVVLGTIALDANGARVATKPPTWRSGNTNIVIASDTGLMYGKAVGTTNVYATIDGHTDSAVVTVVASLPTQPPPPAVASFDLSAVIVAGVPGTDTTKIAPIAGAVVKLSRIGGISGDSLSQAIDAGSAVSDANGMVGFKSLPGGSYAVKITPPAGSPYDVVSSGFAPPRTAAVQLQFRLPPKTP